MNDLYFPLGLSSLAIAWFLTRRKRTLPTTEELLRRLHPDPLKGLDAFLPYNPIKYLFKKFMDSDEEFYRVFGGYSGFVRKLQDAVCYVQLCQQLHRNNGMPWVKFGIVLRKAFFMLFAILLSIPEEAFRVLFHRLPHFCARWMAQLYYDLSIEAENLNLEYGNGNWISHA